MHGMQIANRQTSMAINAPPPAAPIMMYTCRFSLSIISSGAVTSLAVDKI